MKKVRARPRRIPAFGEWNYYDDRGGYGPYAGGDWPVTQYFESAMHAGGMLVALPVTASPKPAKKAVTWSSGTTLENETDEEVQGRQRQKVVVGLRERHGAAKKTQTAAGAPVVAAKASRRAVKAVDEDLYVISPDMLRHNPRKRLAKRLWIGGCLGLGCLA